MPPVGFEPTISAGERPQTYALDRAATGTGINEALLAVFRRNVSLVYFHMFYLNIALYIAHPFVLNIHSRNFAQ